MEHFFFRIGGKLVEFKGIAVHLAERLKAHAHRLAHQAGRPYQYLNEAVCGEELARQVARHREVQRGLVRVFGTVEPVQAFRLVYGQGHPRLRSDWRKCLVHYFYLIDPQFGLMHVRRLTWFPFTMQVYVNGHEWLARRMSRLRLIFERLEITFVTIPRPRRADHLAREFARLNRPEQLDRFARRFNPLLPDVLETLSYYWVTGQAEYATDVMFASRADLQGLYPSLLRHATPAFQADDTMKSSAASFIAVSRETSSAV